MQQTLNNKKKEISFVADSNKPNLIAHFIEFSIIIALLFYFVKKTIFNPSPYYAEAFLILITLLILFFYLKRKNREPSFVTISDTQITFRSFYYFFEKKVELHQIKGYSIIKKPYYLYDGRIKKLYPSYLIYLKDDSKKLLIDYNINNFNELNRKLKKVGIKYLGIDEPEWLGPRKKYKFD